MIFYLLLLALLLTAPAASGHVPLLPEGNDNLSSAEYISDPDKSWAIYSQLQPDEAHYYSFDVEKGGRIYLSLLSSTNPGEESYQPDMALLGPDLESDIVAADEAKGDGVNDGEIGGNFPGGDLPGYVALPEDYGFIAVQGQRAENATYEPFGPSSYYEQAEIDITAPESGRYYAVVYDSASENISGHYALALGYLEEFTFTDRVLTPLRLVSVYMWEGQRLMTIITPWLVAALAGIFVILRSSRRTPFFTAGTLAGFLYIGTSASVLTQTIFSLTRAPYGPEVGISLGLALIPIVLGIAAIRLARGEAGILQRSLLAVIGTLGLLAGSGFIIGPLLAVAASVLPNRKRLMTPGMGVNNKI